MHDGSPMEPSPAPFFAEIAEGPDGGTAHWLTASDGLRIRAGHWRPEGECRGTVFLFPGRTEYIEKYGTAARDLTARGYAVLTIDWRGQGLADRLLDDRRLGHVDRFTDYQKDIAALQALAEELELPQPWHLLAHSMGGAIGLRWVMAGAPVETCAFTGPMWGIHMSPWLRPVAEVVSSLAPRIGQGNRLLPTTAIEPYVHGTEFADNMLTGDPDMFAFMQKQLTAQPDLNLGGPTIDWLGESLRECRLLAARPSPGIPCVTFLGSEEEIVGKSAIRDRMARWEKGELVEIPKARHEVLVETPAIRAQVFDRLETLFTERR
jgi:lysophospholipase